MESQFCFTTRSAAARKAITTSPRRLSDMTRKALGRGLSALLGEVETATTGLEPLPISLIDPNPYQPRRNFSEESLRELPASIRSTGLVQPVLVRRADNRYQLIAGERRWRAARMAGLESVPALVRPRDDAEALELALIENMAREGLNPIEEARACAALVEELGLTREDVGRRVGRSRVAVS